MKKFKVVKSAKAIAKLADTWWMLRTERLEKEKEAERIKEQESAAKAALLESLKNSATAIGGSLVTVERIEKSRPIVNDWPALHGHIKKTGEFDLLHRRLSESAVKERWEDDNDVPGVGSLPYDDISYSKRKE